MTNNYKKGRLGYGPPSKNGICFVEIVSGEEAAVGISNTGKLYSVGQGGEGQLGRGDITLSCSWGRVCSSCSFKCVIWGGGGGIQDDGFFIGMTVDGKLFSWGNNCCGQLGDGTTINRCQPVPVCCNYTYTEIIINGVVGDNSVVGIRTDGTAVAWGSNNAGQLGVGAVYNSSTVPVAVGCNYCYKKLAKNKWTFVGLKTDGTAVLWGSGACLPIPICCNYCYSEISGGNNHYLGLKTDGTIVAWGSNNLGQLGNNSTIDSAITPVNVCGGGGWCKVCATDTSSSFAFKTNGQLYGWGCNGGGILGQGNSSSGVCQPVITDCSYCYCYFSIIKSVAVAIKTDGCAVAWGQQTCGALGNNVANTSSKCSPTAVCCDYSFYKAVVINSYLSGPSVIGIKTDGTTVAWGSNYHGQLGRGTSCCCSMVPVSSGNPS
jgi:alpha-tubulin suppressor-like RCC1 family protein